MNQDYLKPTVEIKYKTQLDALASVDNDTKPVNYHQRLSEHLF